MSFEATSYIEQSLVIQNVCMADENEVYHVPKCVYEVKFLRMAYIRIEVN